MQIRYVFLPYTWRRDLYGVLAECFCTLSLQLMVRIWLADELSHSGSSMPLVEEALLPHGSIDSPSTRDPYWNAHRRDCQTYILPSSQYASANFVALFATQLSHTTTTTFIDCCLAGLVHSLTK